MSYTSGYYIGDRHVRGRQIRRTTGGQLFAGMMGLGSLDAAVTFNVGQQLVAGYNVQSSATAAQKLQAVRDAMAYGFRGSIVGAGWGGPGAPGGVPAGQIWIKVQIGTTGITGAAMNSIFSNVGARIQSQLPAGSHVTNTFASTFGGLVGAPAITGTAPTTTDPLSLLTQQQQLTPGMMPTDQGSFFTQDVGGIPMWGIIAGGVVGVGAVAFALTRKPAAVKANRRKSRHRKKRRSTRQRRKFGSFTRAEVRQSLAQARAMGYR